MARVTAFTAERSKNIEDQAVVSGLVDASGRLILSRNNGTTIDAGSVKGSKGDQGDPGTGVSFVAGLIFAFGGGTPPSGYLICNGAAVSRTTYAALFSAIGTNYGAGNGSTTFNLPDFRGRQVMGLDSTQTEFSTLAKTGGHKLMQRHQHYAAPGRTAQTDSAHVYAWGGGGEGTVNIQNAVAQAGGVTGNRLYTIQDAWNKGSIEGRPSGSEQDNNLDPYGVANYIISIGTITAAGGDPIRADYLLRGGTAERDALFGIPGSNGASIALAKKQILWYNTDKGWEEMYYETHGLAGLGVPGISGRPPGWYPVNAGNYRILPKAVSLGTFDAQGLVVPTGAYGDIWVECFTNEFRRYRITGRLTTDAYSVISMGFIRTTGDLNNTANVHWQTNLWAQANTGALVFGGNNDPSGNPSIGISGTSSVLGHDFDFTVENPFLPGHTHITGTFGMHGGAVGAGVFHGGLEDDSTFKGIRFAVNGSQKLTAANSAFTVYGVV